MSFEPNAGRLAVDGGGESSPFDRLHAAGRNRERNARKAAGNRPELLSAMPQQNAGGWFDAEQTAPGHRSAVAQPSSVWRVAGVDSGPPCAPLELDLLNRDSQLGSSGEDSRTQGPPAIFCCTLSRCSDCTSHLTDHLLLEARQWRQAEEEGAAADAAASAEGASREPLGGRCPSAPAQSPPPPPAGAEPVGRRGRGDEHDQVVGPRAVGLS